MTKVKICGITNLEDALTAVEAGADMLGFNFYRRSPRYIDPRAARRIVERLPAGVLSVGVFVNEEGPGEVLRLAAEAGVGAAQLHGAETPEFCAALGGLWTIKALRVGEDFEVASVKAYPAAAVLLDAHVRGEWGGTGRTFDWELARRARRLVPRLILAGGLTPENVAAAVSGVGPFAVDACSGVEVAPGRKSATLVRRFVAAARGGA
ncbi:MAG TPA: phosphoribosylanthranilate isomerase [Pyrinomonadaceae bacterium]|nr:phosphoribosylanthranilate isomerase [Pyrinomonadaceae bacterium]